MGYSLIDLDEILKNTDILYAHKKVVDGKVEYETLKEHSSLVMKYFKEIDNAKHISESVKKATEHILRDYKQLIEDKWGNFIYDMFVNAVYLHDVGKSNPAFQWKAMDNDNFLHTGEGNSQHSLPSAAIFCDIFYKKVEGTGSKSKCNILKALINGFGYIISRHHSDIGDFSYKDLSNAVGNMSKTSAFDSYKGSAEISIWEGDEKFYKSEYLYILLKLLYSVITACDFAATYEFMNGVKADIADDVNINELINKYENSDIVKTIRENINGNIKAEGINVLRTEIFAECERNINKNKDKYIYYLEAPTGSGKTNTSINIAAKLMKNCGLKNVFYVFPFNTLAEQTSEVMKFWDENRDFVVINSSVPIGEKNSDENQDYEKVYFNYQFANFPVVITSHIRLFDAMFGEKRTESIWLYKLCNSVIILDEIQSYKNDIWSRFINLLYKFAVVFNFKVVIMSATLPRLDELVHNCDEGKICSLIESKKYYENRLFKNRVNLNFDYLNGKKKIEEAVDIIVDIHKRDKSKTILVECISKKTARECFERIKEAVDDDIVVAELTGDDNKAVRRNIIKRIKAREINIVVATQVIEAGVDIDMDIGFKDISTLDSEEQFIGRINRSCKREGIAYFFDCDNAYSIYQGDVRLEYGINNGEMQKLLVDKNFNEYYKKVINKLKGIAESSDYNKNDDNFKAMVQQLQFKKVDSNTRLITTLSYQVVLNYECCYEGVIYKGSDVWSKYKEILSNKDNMSYGECKIKLSHVLSILDLFTFNIIGNKERAEIHGFTDNIGSYFYYEDGEKYITEDGKFNREKYKEDNGSEFI